MQGSKKEYSEYVKQKSPRSKPWRSFPGAFLIGGAICLIGEILRNIFMFAGLDKKETGACVSMLLIFAAAFLTTIGVYDKIARIGGAGTLVPITGFSNAIAASGIESKSEGFVLGVGAKLFTIAGPVIVYGISASIIYGVILWIIDLF